MTDDRLERDLDSLKATLLTAEPVPLGLTARLEAAVARAVAADARIGWEARVVVACLLFIVAWAFAGPRGTLGFAVVAALVAGGYAAVAVGPEGDGGG